MKSDEIKHKMLFELLYRRGYHMAVTEKSMIYGIADVFAMTKARYTHEIEVKVTRADLKSEIDCIELALSGKKQEKPLAKFHKHLAYLKQLKASKYSLFDPETDTRPYIETMLSPNVVSVEEIPNKFSFAVPTDLVEYAKEKLKDTPYGIFAITPTSMVILIKEAKHLHKEKITEKDVMYLLRKVSMEIENIRGKLLFKN